MTHYQGRPTLGFRWLVKGEGWQESVLQQAWDMVDFDEHNKPINFRTEWRDVPVVKDETP